MAKIKSDLKKKYREDDDKGKYTGFSRKCTFLELAQKYISQNSNTEINNIQFWVFCNDNFQKATFDLSLEEIGIKNKAIILIEVKVNNICPSIALLFPNNILI